MNDVLTLLNDYLLLILAIIGALVAIIEKSRKIPITPVKKIIKWIGEVANEEIKEELKICNSKISQLEGRQDMTHFAIKELEKSQDRNEIDRIRYTVLRFESDLRNLKTDEARTQEEFYTIFDMISKYNRLVKKHRVKNSKFEKAENYISKVYEKEYENIEARVS